jgi:hypothetical protein
MKKILTILILISAFVTQAQNLNMATRDRFQRITVSDETGGTVYTRGATCYIPSDWSPTDSLSYVVYAFLGNGSSGGYSDSIVDAPGRLRRTATTSQNNSYYPWDFKLIRNDGKIAKFAVIQLPRYSSTVSSVDDAGTSDALLGLISKFVYQTGVDTTDDRRFIACALSGGPYRLVRARQLLTDTANRHLLRVKRIVFMSPTQAAANALSSSAQYQWHGGMFKVWFATNDNNGGTSPIMAYNLFNKIPADNEKYLDSMTIMNDTYTAPQAGHNWKIWDSCMSDWLLNAPAGTGGDATTNNWRLLIQDTAISNNILPDANAGSDKNITLPTNSITLNGSFSNDSDGSIVSYSWTKISGPSCTLNQPSNAVCNVVNMNTVGTYVFRLTVTDNDGGQDTDDVVAIVNDPGSIYIISDKYSKAVIQ